MRTGEERMYVDPNPGAIIQGGGGADEEYCEYDETGRVLNWWDSEGNKEVYEYEADGGAVCTDAEGSVYRFDPEGNLVYTNDQGSERWAEYNSFGKSVHYKERAREDVYEEWGEYDAAGHLVHMKCSDGREVHWMYDTGGRLLEIRKEDGCFTKNDYWENGNLRMSRERWRYGVRRRSCNEQGLPIHAWYSDGREEYWEYNEGGQETYHGEFQRKECWREYDERGNLIHIRQGGEGRDFGGREEWREYDSTGNLIHKKDNTGFEEWKDYNLAGQVTHYRNNKGISCHREYDDQGRLVCAEYSGGEEEWYLYDEKGNQIQYKRMKKQREDSV